MFFEVTLLIIINIVYKTKLKIRDCTILLCNARCKVFTPFPQLKKCNLRYALKSKPYLYYVLREILLSYINYLKATAVGVFYVFEENYSVSLSTSPHIFLGFNEFYSCLEIQ